MSEKAAAAPVGAVSGALLALGGMVVRGIVDAAFSLVACALVVLTLWLARHEGIRG